MLIQLQLIKAGQCQQQKFSFQPTGSDYGNFKLKSPLLVELQAYNADKLIMVQGFAETRLELSCARCLNAFEYPLHADIEFAVDDNYDEDALFEPEFDLVPYGNGIIDVQPQIDAAVYLGLPLVPLCHERCKGLCSVCGINKNETNCNCETAETDVRWSKLKELLADKEG